MEEHGYINQKENTVAQLNRNKFIDEEVEIMAFFWMNNTFSDLFGLPSFDHYFTENLKSAVY